MNTEEVLLLYESIAEITSKMASAVQACDSADFEALKDKCECRTRAAAAGVPPLEGSFKRRKVELLRQIMANDRAIREVTEPWADGLERIIHSLP